MEDKITYVNTQMCKLTGYSQTELLGAKAYEILLHEAEQENTKGKLKDREAGLSETISNSTSKKMAKFGGEILMRHRFGMKTEKQSELWRRLWI
ncbi:MAG: PAS domain S-box protein [Saprospiraceae bacterium]|nr:PAS domain S-box protein [Saprospiraceae bacterium]